MLKCNLAMLRLTPLLALCALPLALTRLLCYHKRERPPPSPVTPISEAVVLALFPIAWFFGFMYYTEVPSLVFVVLSVVAATQNQHWLSALVSVFGRCASRVKLSGTLNTGRAAARSDQLYIPPKQHHLGAVCLRIQSADVLAFSSCSAGRQAASQAP